MHVEPGPRNETAKKKGVFKKVKSFFFGSKKREGKEVRGFALLMNSEVSDDFIDFGSRCRQARERSAV